MANIEIVKKHNVRDILSALHLGAESAWEKAGPPIVKHITDTAKMAAFWAFVLIAYTLVYIFVASAEYNFNSKATFAFFSHTPLYNIVWVAGVMLLLLSTVMFTLTSARVGLYSGALMLFEAIAIPVVNLLYSLILAIIPNKLEKIFADGQIQALLIKADQERKLAEVADSIIRGYMGGVAWAIFVPWLVISLPLAVFANPLYVLMSIIAIAILIYQVVGFRSDPFWYDLIQQGSMYAAAGYIIIYLVIMPIVNESGAFEGWGPAGYARTAWWFVVFVVVAAIIGSGADLKQSTETGKRRVDFKGTNLFIAAVILVAAFLFGNLLLTKAVGVYDPSKDSPPSPTPQTSSTPSFVGNGKEITVTVPATSEMYNTGINVTGKRIQITYLSGLWSNTSGSGNILTDANGSGSWAGLILPNAPLRSLIGYTDSGPFAVGNSYSGKPGNGQLSLGMNEVKGGFGDNSKSLQVKITILD